MVNTLDRLKILINSSTPIVVMETLEEMRAVGLVRTACDDLNIATFEWSIADGLFRSGSNVRAVPAAALQMRINAARQAADPGAPESSKAAIYNTLDPVQALATMETMTLEAVFVLKDFHRHMESPVVVWRLRDVGHEIFRESAHADTYCAIHQHATRVGEPGGICRSAAARSATVETNCRGNL